MATRKPRTTAPSDTAPTPKRTVPAKAASVSRAQKPARPTVQAPARPAGQASAKPVAAKDKAGKTEKVAKAEKSDKARKPKMVRDSFTMPKPEYAVIEALKDRAAKAGRPAKKSELLRAGVKLLEGLAPAALAAALQALPAIKTGRPARG